MSLDAWANSIQTGDLFDVVPQLPDESIHAVVTDPPYGLAFMGRDWDDFEPREYQDWCMEWAQEVKRVLKPGGHLLAFSGNRTHHRLFTGVEDAGFEIRDTLTWHYGSGFPKASDVSKTIDKRADAEREQTDEKKWPDRGTHISTDGSNEGYKRPSHDKSDMYESKPATEQAKKWDGWKTGLKPSTEYVVMARKPFDGATVDCVLEHGTGALNIKETRIDANPNEDGVSRARKTGKDDTVGDFGFHDGEQKKVEPAGEKGRYPSNVVFDEREAERLDRKNGVRDDGDYQPRSGNRTETQFDPEDGWNDHDMDPSDANAPDSYGGKGGPSRYFYTSKASKSERTEDGSIDNSHPTVKPQDLMEWLIKMVSREGQIVLDPFTGSGTTCKAAKSLNRQFVGIEKQSKWADVARVRCNLTPDDPSIVRDDSAQEGLEAYND